MPVMAETENLLQTLRELRASEEKEVVFEEDFVIHHIPSDMSHPVRKCTVAREWTELFFVSRVQVSEKKEEDDSKKESSEMKEKLHTKTIKFVQIGQRSNDSRTSFMGVSTSTDKDDVNVKYAEWNLQNKGLSLDDARYIVSKYVTSLETADSDSEVVGIPLWALCHNEGMPLIGACPRDSSVQTLTVHNLGDVGTEIEKMPQVSTLLDMPCGPSLDIDIGEQDTKVIACAQYQLLGSDFENATQDQSSISINFEWNRPSKVLCDPPSSANEALYIRAIPGDEQSMANQLYLELQALTQFLQHVKVIKDGGKAEEAWSLSESPTLQSQTKEFIARLEKNTQPKMSSKANHNSRAVDNALSVRTDLDFTEQLWDFVQRATSFSDLRLSLAHIFHALQNGILQPRLHKTNKSKIAKLATQFLEDLGHKKVNNPDLAQLADPVQLLLAIVEIGTEKLQRDYVSHLIGAEVCTGDQLGDIVNREGDSVDKLYCLHNIVELYSVAKSYTDISHGSLRELIRAAITFYTNNGGSVYPTYILPLPPFSESALKIKRLCASIKPIKWELRIQAKNQDDILANFSQTRSPLFPSEDRDFSDGWNKEEIYYCTNTISRNHLLGNPLAA